MSSKAWVVTREYPDRSGYTVLRVHTTLQRAEEDLRLVDGDFGQTYRIHAVELFDEDAPIQIDPETGKVSRV